MHVQWLGIVKFTHLIILLLQVIDTSKQIRIYYYKLEK